VYFGQEIRMSKDYQTAQLNRRVNMAWAAYGRLEETFNSDLLICLKRKINPLEKEEN